MFRVQRTSKCSISTQPQCTGRIMRSPQDESLLCQGLVLNDELQRVLAKHESIASGTSVQVEKPKSEPPQPIVNVDAPLIDTGGRKQSDQGKTLGFELVNRALPEPASPVSQQNAPALVDMVSSPSNSQSPYSVGQTHASSPQFRQQSFTSTQMEVSPELHTHKALTQPGTNRYRSNSCSHLLQFMHVFEVGSQSSSFPPPPWESEAAESSQTVGNPHAQPMQNNQLLPEIYVCFENRMGKSNGHPMDKEMMKNLLKGELGTHSLNQQRATAGFARTLAPSTSSKNSSPGFDGGITRLSCYTTLRLIT
ncbi:hypothetical protein MTR67_036269 [Solanum verrucosum]|uniref:Uncharacterized protein n=1 Tax=Solanum verrucosum TaxID=315347 RepID=A0AAF0UC70_SOLVR|nr:hypothetical protein MTR67_036269 [Solanum verrucosum]